MGLSKVSLLIFTASRVLGFTRVNSVYQRVPEYPAWFSEWTSGGSDVGWAMLGWVLQSTRSQVSHGPHPPSHWETSQHESNVGGSSLSGILVHKKMHDANCKFTYFRNYNTYLQKIVTELYIHSASRLWKDWSFWLPISPTWASKLPRCARR